MVDVMSKGPRSRFNFIGILVLALFVFLWIVLDDSQDGFSNGPVLTPQTAGDDGAPDSVSVGKKDTEQAQDKLKPSRPGYSEKTPPNQRMRSPSGGTEKRRSLQSTIAGIVANRQDGAQI